MTNGEVMISTIESVMGVEFDKSFGWKELDHDVVIAFDGSWWREDKYDDGERREQLPQYAEWKDAFNNLKVVKK